MTSSQYDLIWEPVAVPSGGWLQVAAGSQPPAAAPERKPNAGAAVVTGAGGLYAGFPDRRANFVFGDGSPDIFGLLSVLTFLWVYEHRNIEGKYEGLCNLIESTIERAC